MVRRFHDNLSRSKKTAEDIEQAYQSGYSEGDSAGYTRGDTAGYSRGYSEGEAAGISATKKGTAVAENVLTGKTFTNASGIEIPGTMPDKTGFSQIVTPGTSQQEILIPKGFHDGAGKITVGAGLDTSDATATAANILTGATAYVNNIKVTGSMPNQASWSQTVTPGSAAQAITIPAGYHNGSGKVNVGAASSGDIKEIIRDASEIAALITDSSETFYDGNETRYYKSIQVDPNQTVIFVYNDQAGSYYSEYYYHQNFMYLAGANPVYLNEGYSQSVSPYTYYYNVILSVKADNTGLIKWYDHVTQRTSSGVQTMHYSPVTIKEIIKL